MCCSKRSQKSMPADAVAWHLVVESAAAADAQEPVLLRTHRSKLSSKPMLMSAIAVAWLLVVESAATIAECEPVSLCTRCSKLSPKRIEAMAVAWRLVVKSAVAVATRELYLALHALLQAKAQSPNWLSSSRGTSSSRAPPL